MIRKKIMPIIDSVSGSVTGTTIEYRILGILVYEKTLYLPNKYGSDNDGDCYYISF